MNLLRLFREFCGGLFDVFRESAVSYIDEEIRQLEEVFSIVLFAPFFGFPLPVSFVSVELLPYADEEFLIFLSLVSYENDPFSRLAEFGDFS